MAIKTTDNGQMVSSPGVIQASNGQPDLKKMLLRMGPELAKALPTHLKAERMLRVATTALTTNPNLLNCTPSSFFGSLLSAAQLGLEPNTPLGHAYLIPYKTTCQLIVGYQGMVELALRSGQVKSLYGYVVRSGDEFTHELGLNPTLRHVPSGSPDRESEPVTHVYAVAKLKSGEAVFSVLTRAEVEKFRRRSRSANNGPWVTDYEAMAIKTAVRRLWRWLPKSVEMVNLAAAIDIEDRSDRGGQTITAEATEVLATMGMAPVEHDDDGVVIEAEGEEQNG